MYQQATYEQSLVPPWAGYSHASKQTGAWGDYFRGLAIVAWLFMLCVSFWWIRQWQDTFAVRESGIDKNLQYAGAAVVIIAHLTLGFSVLSNEIIAFFATVKGRMLGGFCLLALALAPLSLSPLRSALYALSTLAVFLVCTLAWNVDYDRYRRVMFIAGAVLLGFLVLLAVHHGMGKTSVGGIQRNRYSQTAFAGMICMFVARGSTKWFWFAVAVGLALLVNSRGTLLVLGVFAIVYLTLKYGAGRGILIGMLMMIGGLIFLAIPRIGSRASEAMVEKVARVHEAGRGVGSGFSGRLDTWKEGLRVFARSPAIGHGFRSRVGGMTGDAYLAHSGYVNMLADVGLVGAVLVIGALVYDATRRLGVIRQIKRQFGSVAPPALEDTYELNLTICAFLVAEAILWLFEPLYLNLGATVSVLFLLMVMAPYYVGRGAAVLPYFVEPGRR